MTLIEIGDSGFCSSIEMEGTFTLTLNAASYGNLNGAVAGPMAGTTDTIPRPGTIQPSDSMCCSLAVCSKQFCITEVKCK